MAKKVYTYSLQTQIFKNILDVGLLESMDVEPGDTEDLL